MWLSDEFEQLADDTCSSMWRRNILERSSTEGVDRCAAHNRLFLFNEVGEYKKYHPQIGKVSTRLMGHEIDILGYQCPLNGRS